MRREVTATLCRSRHAAGLDVPNRDERMAVDSAVARYFSSLPDLMNPSRSRFRASPAFVGFSNPPNAMPAPRSVISRERQRTGG